MQVPANLKRDAWGKEYVGWVLTGRLRGLWTRECVGRELSMMRCMSDDVVLFVQSYFPLDSSMLAAVIL